MIGFTSGSTGVPQAHPKKCWSLAESTSRNSAAIRARLSGRFGDARPWIVATVPPQHVYGMEMSILLPALGDMAVHCGRPMFPQDVAGALADVPEPRVLVTTPVHLRVLSESGIRFPDTALIMSATAPLDVPGMPLNAERAFRSTLLEIFGSTETCALAQRRTAIDEPWHLREGARLEPGEHGTVVEAPWLPGPVNLQDVVELVSADQFPPARAELRPRRGRRQAGISRRPDPQVELRAGGHRRSGYPAGPGLIRRSSDRSACSRARFDRGAGAGSAGKPDRPRIPAATSDPRRVDPAERTRQAPPTECHRCVGPRAT